MSLFTVNRYKAKLTADKYLKESAQPTEGIYYIIRLPKGWELLTHRHDEFPEEWNHEEVWRADVAPMLARAWTKIVGVPSDKLTKQLEFHYTAFPRGRIGRDGVRWIVRHGNNLAPFMGISRSRVERAFELPNAQWELDLHEQCLPEDAEAVQRILKLKEQWKVSPIY